MKWYIGGCGAVLLGILFFGLWPGQFHFANKAGWIVERAGLRFKKYGLAYTDPFAIADLADDADTHGFSIEIALKALSYHEDGFNFILALYSGSDRDQLLVGQWRAWLIVMNGDDYDHRRRTQRISVNLAAASRVPAAGLVTITTGKDGTRVYLDGRLSRTNKDLRLRLPDSAGSRLLLGNSVYGRHSWQGDIYGLAFYRGALAPRVVAAHFLDWSKKRNFLSAVRDNPFLLYTLDEKKGKRALEHAGGKNYLSLPSRMPILKKSMLSLELACVRLNRSFIRDALANFAGFIPLGFVLMATFAKAGGRLRKHGILISVAVCFAVSLGIEIVQAWMPSRSSDGIDLALNTLGGLVGCAVRRGKGQGQRRKDKGKRRKEKGERTKEKG